MHREITDYDALRREALRLRARAMADLWARLAAALSPRVPKLFPADF